MRIDYLLHIGDYRQHKPAVYDYNGYDNSHMVNYYVFVMASVDILDRRLHLKVLLFSDSQTSPLVYTRTRNHNLVQPWSNLNKVQLRNKLTNNFNLKPFCGRLQRVWWFGGLYYEDHSMNIDLEGELKIHWIGIDSGSLVNAKNQIDPFKDQGKYGG